MQSDPDHVRFLNQQVSRTRIDAGELERRLRSSYELAGRPLSAWIVERFVERFFGRSPHPFVLALQHPSRTTLLGYVIEHQHFLRQWVRSCALIVARCDRDEVIRYELDNLETEFGGSPGRPAHYELLLQMGESLGMPRSTILAIPPLPATRAGIDGWQRICSTSHWVEAVAAMHSLELIAHRDLAGAGATLHYFDPAILGDGSITDASRAFLREGYEADVGHSAQALALVDRYASELQLVDDVQSTVLRSIDLFDDYLIARLVRGERLDG